MTPANICELLVDGTAYGGWKAIDVERSIETIAGSFRLHLSQRWPGTDVPPGLREGLPCEVRIGEDVVITGYIDEYEPELTKDSTSITVEGRDKTGDLVDCSAIYKAGAWQRVQLQQIVRDICTPFGITVQVSPGVDTGEVFKRFALEDGEKAFDAIDRACRLRAVLCTSTPEGGLLLTQASEVQSGVTLEEGVNIQSIRASHSWKDRFSKVTVKAQAPGDDDQYAEAVSQLNASSVDAEINRYRPLIVQAEHHTSTAALIERAQWEVNVRMGRGKRGSCTVVGWRTGKDGQEGELWRPNTLVRVISGRMNLDREVLIVACHYQSDEAGQKTTLTFARPEAFALVDGAKARRLGRKLSVRVDAERKRKQPQGGYTPSWDREPPVEVGR